MESVPSQDTSSDQWEEVLRAAPDATFYGELTSFLRSVDLSGKLVHILNDTYVYPWERVGIASAHSLAALWINLGMAAIEPPVATPEAGDFALVCSDLANKFTTSYPDLEMFRLCVRSKALLILALGEETTTPDICRNLAIENAKLLAIVREQADEGLGEVVRRVLSPALELSLNSLRLLVRRRALEVVGYEVTRLAEMTLELSDHASQKDPLLVAALWTTIRMKLQEDSHPCLEIRRYAAYGRYQLCRYTLIGFLASDAPRGLCQHASRALEHLDCMAGLGGASAAGFNRRDRLLKGQILDAHGCHEDAVKEIDLIPEPLEAMEIEIRSFIQGRECFKKGHLKQAQEAYLRGCSSAEEMVRVCLSRWLGQEVSPDVLSDLTGIDPLEVSQGGWRMLARISATVGSKKDAIRWISQTGGFLVDSLTEHRGEWAARFRRKDFGVGMMKMGWSGSTAATAAHHMYLTAQLGHGPQIVPRADGPLPANRAKPPDPEVQVREALGSMTPGTAILQPLVIEGRIFTFIYRMRESEVDFSEADESADFSPVLELMREWDEEYFVRTREGTNTEARAEHRSSILSRMLGAASSIWGAPIEKLLDSGVSRLIFVPDDLIADLPFHVITLPQTGQLLIDRCEVSYSVSIYSLWECCRHASPPVGRRREVALVSLLDTGLPTAGGEAEQVAAILQTEQVRLAPSEPSFWSQISQAEVLHIAAHGELRALLPLNSRILAGGVDVPLTALIAGLDLPKCAIVSNLVCESALQSVRNLPGVNLSSVFLASGARSVLASTWVVEDSLASELACLFFRRWIDEVSPAKCLRFALDELRQRHTSIPVFYWAGVRLIGAP